MSNKYSKSNIYDNWERLVAAASKKQQLWELFHQQSRSPSIRSEASDFTPSSSSRYSIYDVVVDNLSPGSSSRWEEAFAKLHSKLVYVSDFNPALDVDFVVLGSSELLGRGTFGSAHAAVMENGVKIVVRRMKHGITELEFQQNMEIIRNVKHENVVPLRAYYSFEDERLMLYDHYIQGSVYSLLHGRNDGAQIEWETRMRIAIGAAYGIDEIHSQNGGNLVHGNIKASNIFINAQGYGCISDLGLANMVVSTPFLPTAWCYAPEVENTQNISQQSDVYSYGILLLELLTRKSPTYIPGGPHAVNLVKLVTSVKSKVWAVRVFDADLLKNPKIKDQMVKMLQIGISCVAKSPKRRPKMPVIVTMLEDINVKIPASPTSVQKLVFIDNSNPSFDLELLLRSDAEKLGKGTYGTSYKAVLENGNTVRVKRVKDESGVLEEKFHQHMERIGRIRHVNVGELRAYFFSNDEQLLIYDYHNQSCVSTLLHGRTEMKEPLDWAARLKIANGTARGIAYIHRQDGGAFVHGSIKTTNIFLNEQQFGLITDNGLAKLFGSSRSSTLLLSSHYAPEVTNTRRVSQASDVYSFGVVLLELVSGKPPRHTKGDDEVSLVEWIQSAVQKEWSQWTIEVIDIELLRDENDFKAIERLLQIGLDCVASAPKRRPKMTQVVKMLDEISGVYNVEKSSVEYELEYMLEDLLPMLKL